MLISRFLHGPSPPAMTQVKKLIPIFICELIILSAIRHVSLRFSEGLPGPSVINVFGDKNSLKGVNREPRNLSTLSASPCCTCWPVHLLHRDLRLRTSRDGTRPRLDQLRTVREFHF